MSEKNKKALVDGLESLHGSLSPIQSVKDFRVVAELDKLKGLEEDLSKSES